MAASKLRTQFIRDSLNVKVHELKKSGLTVVHAHRSGPIVSGNFLIATEAKDDAGMPHCLEHLIFLGSEDHPMKGLLDSVANRSCAEGTNAWTAEDHTAYTMSTAGADGFLQLAPLFLDHILHPTLTSEGYLTEVHHVDGEGKDGGVLYNELQGKENTADEVVELALLRSVFPKGCGYRYDTGGQMEAVRNECGIEPIRQFHRQMYNPPGVCLVVVGDINEEAIDTLLASLEEVACKKIPSSEGPQERNRAFSESFGLLESSTSSKVSFPADEADTGKVVMAWQPSEYSEFEISTALGILTDYLSSTSVAPLQKELVESSDPLAGSVGFNESTFKVALLQLHIDSVPFDKIDDAADDVVKLLRAVADETYEEFSVDFISTLIYKARRDHLEAVECEPEELVPGISIPQFLYGERDWKGMEGAFDELKRLDKLLHEPKGFWISLLNERILNRPCSVVKGSPDTNLGDELTRQEEKLIEARRRELGENGLLDLQIKLEKAHEKNDAPLDLSLVKQFPLPPIDNIRRHSLRLERRGSDNIGGELMFADVSSSFVTSGIVAKCDALTTRQLGLVPLLLSTMFTSEIRRQKGSGGETEVVPHEQVVQEIAETTLSTSATLGYGGKQFFGHGLFNCVSVTARMPSEKYVEGTKLLMETASNGVPSRKRIRTMAKRALNRAPKKLRDGALVAHDMLSSLVFDGGTPSISSAVQQQAILRQVMETIDGDRPESIVEELREVREKLFGGRNAFAFAIGSEKLVEDKRRIEEPWEWQNVSPIASEKEGGGSGANGMSSMRLPKLSAHLKLKGNQGRRGTICGVKSVESGYLELAKQAVDTLTHKDAAAIKVTCELLQALEGPFWREIRGNGLAYGANVNLKSDQGILNFTVYRSSQLVDAFKKARAIVKQIEKEGIDDISLENAVSASVYGQMASEHAPSEAGEKALVNQMRGMEKGEEHRLLERIRSVSAEDVNRVVSEYFVGLFEDGAMAICTSPSRVADVVDGFHSIGWSLEPIDLAGNATEEQHSV